MTVENRRRSAAADRALRLVIRDRMPLPGGQGLVGLLPQVILLCHYSTPLLLTFILSEA